MVINKVLHRSILVCPQSVVHDVTKLRPDERRKQADTLQWGFSKGSDKAANPCFRK